MQSQLQLFFVKFDEKVELLCVCVCACVLSSRFTESQELSNDSFAFHMQHNGLHKFVNCLIGDSVMLLMLMEFQLHQNRKMFN